MDSFNNFKETHTCKDTIKAFNDVKAQLGLTNTPHDQFFEQLCYGLKKEWKVKKFLEELKKKFAGKEFKKTNKGNKTKVLVVGAGPCGLRIAIEAAFLGCKVVVVDKRSSFTRNNVLHLWPFTVTDLKNLGIKFFFAQFCCGDLDHISIRRLQLCLLKIALVVGVDVQLGVTYKGLRLPEPSTGNDWGTVCEPNGHPVNKYVFDVFVAATGSRDVLSEYEMYSDNDIVTTRQGFERKEFRGQLSIAITANFVNSNTKAERKIKELGGIASHFNQKLFKELRKKDIHLENIVYFRDETHYFVMTAKKESLVQRRVIKNGDVDPSELLGKENIDLQSLLKYTRDAANHCTNNAMGNIQFAQNASGREDVSMFDFSSKLEAVNSSRIIERNGKQLLLCLVGDSLIEPFWPQGTGCARGFLGAFDAVWMIKNFKTMKMTPLQAIAERESVYKILSTTTSDNIKKEYSKFTIDPSTRYKAINMKAVLPNDAAKFYDKLDDLEVNVTDESPRKKQKPNDDAIDLDEVLLWCQKVLNKLPEFEIQNLSSSWRSGCELGMLIHTFEPSFINIRDLDAKDPVRTMNIVVGIAQNKLGIYPILTVSEMTKCSSKLADQMAIYISQFYVRFKDLPIPDINEHDGKCSPTDDKIDVDVEEDSFNKAPSTDVKQVVENLQPALDNTQSDVKEPLEDITTSADRNTEVMNDTMEVEPSSTATDKDAEKYNAPDRKPRLSRVELPVEENKENSSDVCYICKEAVFAMERINVEDVFCHRSCLRCAQCYCHLNLDDFRTQKSSKGEKMFYCPKHAGPRSRFTQSIRKRPSSGFGLANLYKPQQQYRKVEFNMGKEKPIPPPKPKRDKPAIPPRPDFLARRVTPGSIRRTEFYNAPDGDDKDSEREDKIFEHNFGASIRKGLGAFSVYAPDPDEDRESSSESDSNDDIGEQLETVVDMGMNVDLSKNLTIRDAAELWKTLKRTTASQMNVIKHLTETASDPDEMGDDDVNDKSLHRYSSITEEDDEQELNETIKGGDLTKFKDPKIDLSDISRSLKGNERFENAVKDLNRESKELSDKFSFSATCYRPNKRQTNNDFTDKDTAQIRRPRLRRCDSDETDVRHAQRVQMAARKLALQRQQNKIYMMQELKRQLEEAEQALLDVEKEGVEIEKALKESTKTKEDEKPELQRRLCSLYCRRQKLLEYEAELIAASRDVYQEDSEANKDRIKCISNPTHSSSSDDDDPILNQGVTVEAKHKGLDEKQRFTIDFKESFRNFETDVDKTIRIPEMTDKTESEYLIHRKANDEQTDDQSFTSGTVLKGRTSYLETNVIAFDESYRNFETDVDRTIRIPHETDHTIPKVLSDGTENHGSQMYANDNKISPQTDEDGVPSDKTIADDFQEQLTFNETSMADSIWECPFCTFHNKEDDSYCGACLAWQCDVCTFVNPGPQVGKTRKRCEMCHSNRPVQDQSQIRQTVA